MSVRVMSEVWSLALPATQKLVLLALADHADDRGGNAYPSVSGLAQKCGVDARTIQRSLRTLEAAGLLAVERHATQHFPNTYRVVPGAALRRGDNMPGRQSVASGVTSVQSRGGTVPPEPSGTIKEPSLSCASEPTFAVFWRDYPKHVDKQEALGLWKKIKLDEVPAIMLGLRRWKGSGQWDDVQFCPSPARWLRRRKWEDEPPKRVEVAPDRPAWKNSGAPVEARQNVPSYEETKRRLDAEDEERRRAELRAQAARVAS